MIYCHSLSSQNPERRVGQLLLSSVQDKKTDEDSKGAATRSQMSCLLAQCAVYRLSQWLWQVALLASMGTWLYFCDQMSQNSFVLVSNLHTNPEYFPEACIDVFVLKHLQVSLNVDFKNVLFN